MVRRWAPILGAFVTLLVAAPAGAQAYSAVSRTSVGFLHHAEQLWTASIASPAACAAPMGVAQPTAIAAAFTPPRRLASLETRGELVGEFGGAPPIPESSIDKALACAARVREEVGTRKVLSEGSAGFRAFHAGFADCMAADSEPHPVGSMTLWVDTHCNW